MSADGAEATASTTPKAAAKKASAPVKRSAAASTTAPSAAKKASGTRPTTRPAAPRATAPTAGSAAAQPALEPRPLFAREPREIATAAGLALAALVADAVEAVGRLPQETDRLREEVRPLADEAPRRLRRELARAEATLTAAVDARVPRGRAAIAELTARPEVRELRERADTVRERVRRAVEAVVPGQR